MVVGLHCIRTNVIDWRESSFDSEDAMAFGDGNILPFHEHTGKVMETWIEHRGMIRAMAVIPYKYIFSYSGCDDLVELLGDRGSVVPT